MRQIFSFRKEPHALNEPTYKSRAPRNHTIMLTEDEMNRYQGNLLSLHHTTSPDDLFNHTIHQDLLDTIPHLPDQFVDLLFIDPPYNLTKAFNKSTFTKMNGSDYAKWFESWFVPLLRVLKPTASVYICGDWRSSSAIEQVASQYLLVQNRITWEREKGRGAQHNWKNASEDIWFFTMSKDYVFHVDDVKMKRKVIAPYRLTSGEPKDWEESTEGNYRLTYPSNLWTDLTVPFWSMPENTDHPTQKPEKLMAKIILASSRPGDVVLDPFLGSGTTSVVAKKLDRQFVGIERDLTYCCLSEKRLEMAAIDRSIQGYQNGFFWERNSLKDQKSNAPNKSPNRSNEGEQLSW